MVLCGRMINCKHIFCLSCANKNCKSCPRCKEQVLNIEKKTPESLFICELSESCYRSYLSERDLEAHVIYRHRRKRKIKKNPAVNEKKDLNNSKSIPDDKQSISDDKKSGISNSDADDNIFSKMRRLINEKANISTSKTPTNNKDDFPLQHNNKNNKISNSLIDFFKGQEKNSTNLVDNSRKKYSECNIEKLTKKINIPSTKEILNKVKYIDNSIPKVIENNLEEINSMNMKISEEISTKKEDGLIKETLESDINNLISKNIKSTNIDELLTKINDPDNSFPNVFKKSVEDLNLKPFVKSEQQVSIDLNTSNILKMINNSNLSVEDTQSICKDKEILFESNVQENSNLKEVKNISEKINLNQFSKSEQIVSIDTNTLNILKMINDSNLSAQETISNEKEIVSKINDQHNYTTKESEKSSVDINTKQSVNSVKPVSVDLNMSELKNNPNLSPIEILASGSEIARDNNHKEYMQEQDKQGTNIFPLQDINLNQQNDVISPKPDIDIKDQENNITSKYNIDIKDSKNLLENKEIQIENDISLSMNNSVNEINKTDCISTQVSLISNDIPVINSLETVCEVKSDNIITLLPGIITTSEIIKSDTEFQDCKNHESDVTKSELHTKRKRHKSNDGVHKSKRKHKHHKKDKKVPHSESDKVSASDVEKKNIKSSDGKKKKDKKSKEKKDKKTASKKREVTSDVDHATSDQEKKKIKLSLIDKDNNIVSDIENKDQTINTPDKKESKLDEIKDVDIDVKINLLEKENTLSDCERQREIKDEKKKSSDSEIKDSVKEQYSVDSPRSDEKLHRKQGFVAQPIQVLGDANRDFGSTYAGRSAPYRSSSPLAKDSRVDSKHQRTSGSTRTTNSSRYLDDNHSDRSYHSRVPSSRYSSRRNENDSRSYNDYYRNNNPKNHPANPGSNEAYQDSLKIVQNATNQMLQNLQSGNPMQAQPLQTHGLIPTNHAMLYGNSNNSSSGSHLHQHQRNFNPSTPLIPNLLTMQISPSNSSIYVNTTNRIVGNINPQPIPVGTKLSSTADLILSNPVFTSLLSGAEITPLEKQVKEKTDQLLKHIEMQNKLIQAYHREQGNVNV